MKIPGQPYAYCNRPHTAFTIPVTLLHPLLGKFVDECETYEPNKDDNTFVSDLSEPMSQLGVPEQTRQNDFRQCFLNYTGIQLQTGPVGMTPYWTDGHATVRDYLFVLTEAKAELSSKSKADPTLQGLLYYHEFVKYAISIRPAIARTALPCLFIFYVG